MGRGKVGYVDLLHRWLKRVRESAFAHYVAEEKYSRLRLIIGVPAAFMSAIVGTSVFAALDSNSGLDTRVKIIVGVMSILAAVLTGLQTFLRFSERAEQHRKIATEFGILRRYIEANLTANKPVSDQLVDDIRKRIDDLTKSAPNVPPNVWDKAVKRASSSGFFLSDLNNLNQTHDAAAVPRSYSPPRSVVIHPTARDSGPNAKRSIARIYSLKERERFEAGYERAPSGAGQTFSAKPTGGL
jgi:hypothetical protein